MESLNKLECEFLRQLSLEFAGQGLTLHPSYGPQGPRAVVELNSKMGFHIDFIHSDTLSGIVQYFLYGVEFDTVTGSMGQPTATFGEYYNTHHKDKVYANGGCYTVNIIDQPAKCAKELAAKVNADYLSLYTSKKRAAQDV